MRSLFRKPATLMYPVVPRDYPERTRGHIAIDIEACIFCGICSRKCPTDAIDVDRNAKTWTIRRMSCVQCSCCVEACPKKCLLNEAAYTAPDVVKIVDVFEKATEAEKPEPAGEPVGKPTEGTAVKPAEAEKSTEGAAGKPAAEAEKSEPAKSAGEQHG